MIFISTEALWYTAHCW